MDEFDTDYPDTDEPTRADYEALKRRLEHGMDKGGLVLDGDECALLSMVLSSFLAQPFPSE